MEFLYTNEIKGIMKKVAIYNLSEFEWEQNSLALYILKNQQL